MRIMNAMLVVLFILVLCTGASGQSNTQRGIDRSFEDIKARGVMIVGIEDSFPPMAFRDAGTNELAGLDIDLARNAGERLGLKVEFKTIRWDKTIPRLNTGDVDVVWCGLSILPEREHQMLFSQPYLESRQVSVVK